MSYLSVDIIRPVELESQNATRGTRKKKFWLLSVVCIHTGLVDLVMMKNTSTSAIFTALLMVQQVYGPIISVLAD